MLRSRRLSDERRFARLLPAALVCVLSFACSEPNSEPEPERNVLLVTLSSTRADRLGCYGYEPATTPFLDGLALEGVRFENAYATSGLAPVSQASILTGQNNAAHGLRGVGGDLNHRLPGAIPTLPQILGNRGWRTAGFVSSYLASDAFGLGRGYQQFQTRFEPTASNPTSEQPEGSPFPVIDARANGTQRRSDATTDAALTWLEEHAEQGPWHIWVQYADVHDLALVPPKSHATTQGIDYTADLGLNPMDSRDALYDMELAYTDSQLGRLLEYLRNTGQYENTLIVVIGDQGQGLLEGEMYHQWSHQGLLYNWSLHVPLIVKLPDFPPGVVVPDLVRTIDVLPTILEGVDRPAAAEPDGRSLLPILRGQLDEPRLAFADALILQGLSGERQRYPERHRDNLFSVMNDRWKLIHHERKPGNSELYDLLNDPHESENLFGVETEMAERLLRSLKAREGLRRESGMPGGAQLDAQKLKALGYAADKD